MSEPLVTVVTPSYNQGQYIRATIESVLSQNYPNLEYIIMDGGSTDATASVVKDYASRLTFLSERDRGQSHAINKGFRMARGAIVSWLNSDDLYLPGAILKAVEAFQRNPAAGAVYGEGYLIDSGGHTTSRFPHTEAFNLWKLMHLSDYILQQTVYFRKDVLDEIGYLDEDLHYTMDWEILIRIGKCYPLEYIPEYMGCLREHAGAKTSSGGAKRAEEIGRMLRRYTGLHFPPGYVVYGLDTYHRLWCEWMDRFFTQPFKPVSKKLQAAVRLAAGFVIGRTIRESQGLSSDGWACRVLRYMLPPGYGPLFIEGAVPYWWSLRRQKLEVEANGCCLGDYDVAWGEFQLAVKVPTELEGRLLRLKIKASRWVGPNFFTLPGDRRRLAYQFKSIRWAQPQRPAARPVVPACTGQ
jgi:glycosyltransferase involved in cell wall biosynthesis